MMDSIFDDQVNRQDTVLDSMKIYTGILRNRVFEKISNMF